MTDQPAAFPNDIEQIAVICPTWIGDVVMATPVFRALREHRSQAQITGIIHPGHDELLRGTPWFDELVVVKSKGIAGPLRVGGALGRRKIQAVLLLPNSFRSALAARLGRVQIRLGYCRDGRSFLLSHAVPLEQATEPTPAVHYYAAMGCAALGIESVDEHLELVVTEEQHEAANRILTDVSGPFVILNPGASKSIKRWPAEHFAAVADALTQSRNMTVLVNGSISESGVAAEIIDKTQTQIVNLIERGVTLGALKAIIQRASLVITNDTGPRHIALALGRPTVTLFGPTDHRWTNSDAHQAQEQRLLAEPFLPQALIADRHPQICMIDRITVADVLAAAERALDVDCAADS